MQGKCLLTKEVVYTASDIQHSKISKIGLGTGYIFPTDNTVLFFKFTIYLGSHNDALEEDGEETPQGEACSTFCEFVVRSNTH